uniref:Tumor necrosis factor receptor superfamily, member 1a n=1 Tax=Amphilophus citrinellus TaxID=61819 RepID=A0A3Q0RY11_AMPCI
LRICKLMMIHLINHDTLLQENKTCKLDEFLTEDGICCNKCSPGFKLLEKCHGPKERSNCIHCPDGQYIDQMNYSNNCRQSAKHEIEESPCNRYQNTKCRCEDGYYKNKIDSVTYECRRCKKCKADEVERGTFFPEVTKSVNPDGYVLNVISGIGAVIIVLLVLVVFITYMLTKRYTKKRILRSSQRSDASQESCEVLRFNCPVCRLQQKASYCIQVYLFPSIALFFPLSAVSELIYTVLDLVPVVQVKQLVRLLGVTDTEIEQAELDYRSCREAHYQMLRAWGSRSGGGGRGGMLHRPLLKELLEKLRMMHLGKAAEELETKYGIQ